MGGLWMIWWRRLEWTGEEWCISHTPSVCRALREAFHPYVISCLWNTVRHRVVRWRSSELSCCHKEPPAPFLWNRSLHLLSGLLYFPCRTSYQLCVLLSDFMFSPFYFHICAKERWQDLLHCVLSEDWVNSKMQRPALFLTMCCCY